jgi:NADH-quinone oxidoreductase subunit G
MAADLDNIISGRHSFSKTLKAAKRPMLILGQGALTGSDGAAVLDAARTIAESHGMILADDGWNGFNILHNAAARVGGLDLGFLPGPGGLAMADILNGTESGAIDAVYLLGADEIDMSRLGKAFVIYQGHHGDAGAHRADVILPGAAYTEKNGTYVNTEGRAQFAHIATFPPGDAREDWTIVRALSAVLGATIPFDRARQLQDRLAEINPVFTNLDQVTPAAWGDFGTKGTLNEAPLVSSVENFYMTDPISRASETMAQCTAQLLGGYEGKTGTDG